MTKKVLAVCLAVLLLGGLAYYSSYLLSSRHYQEETRQMQERLDREREKQLLLEKAAAEEEARRREEEEQEQEKREVLAESSVKAEIPGGYTYYLIEEFGYVNIYLSDGETLYENTEIAIDDLPQELQEEICTGKGVATEQALYDFLENYSS